MPHKEWIVNGEKRPSVTQITGVIEKPWKEKWQRRVGFAESDRISKFAADIGTEFHSYVEAWIKGKEIKEKKSKAYKMSESLIENWIIPNKVYFVETEKWMTHDVYEYHGTVDAIAKIDNRLWIIDWKSSKAIDDLHGLQLAAYAELYNYNVLIKNEGDLADKHQNINDGGIVRLDKKTLQPEIRTFNNLRAYFGEFVCAHSLWKFVHTKGIWE